MLSQFIVALFWRTFVAFNPVGASSEQVVGYVHEPSSTVANYPNLKTNYLHIQKLEDDEQ